MGQSGSARQETSIETTHQHNGNSVLSINICRRLKTRKAGITFSLFNANAPETCIEPTKPSRSSEQFVFPKEGKFSNIEVDHEGIDFEVPGIGLTIFAPPGVVLKGQKKSILVGVTWEDTGDAFISWKDDCIPDNTTTGRIVSPVVICQFVGLLEKPLSLRFPHSVANGSFLRGLVALQNFTRWSCIQGTDVWTKAAISNEISNWDFENQTSAIVYQDRCLFFTRNPVTIACACTNHNNFRIALNMCVLVYHDKLSENNDIKFRVYIGDNNPDNLMCIEQKETKIGGTKCPGDRDFTFTENELDLKIEVVDVDSGWICSERSQTIDYFSLWLGSRMQSRTFTFELQGTSDEFKCTFAVFQGKRKSGPSVDITLSKNHLIDTPKPARVQDQMQMKENEGASKVFLEVSHETKLLQARGEYPVVCTMPSPTCLQEQPSESVHLHRGKAQKVNKKSPVKRRGKLARSNSFYSDDATIEMMVFM